MDCSPVKLAYLGDAVFELMVRRKNVVENGAGLNEINKMTVNYVRAGAQAQIYHKIIPYLTEEEASIIKRGRNAKPNISSKNAAAVDYRHATGLEALFGYLYLNNKTDRLNEVFELCVEDCR